VREDELRGKPFFVAHGTEDALLSVEQGRAVRDTLSAFESDLTYREYVMGHQVVQPELDEINSWLTTQLDARATS
jgi:phospholipase/carboxylesterase